uniref:Thiamin pyrophosphokinase 1 n=1 Tax=Lygus hesperus TaxID=30085 RepID=A0A0A9YF58_LYGHE
MILHDAIPTQHQQVPSKPWPIPDVILCLGAFGGRFDQEMNNIYTLYTVGTLLRPRVVLMGLQNLVELINPGVGVLLPSSTYQSAPYYCGLLPISNPVRCTSVGFTWNLGSQGEQDALLTTVQEHCGRTLHNDTTTGTETGSASHPEMGDTSAFAGTVMEFTGLISTNNISNPVRIHETLANALLVRCDRPLLYTSCISDTRAESSTSTCH